MHVDIEPGDRASLCKGIMEPVSVWVLNCSKTAGYEESFTFP
nr:RNHCP domain-containing protein [uncultured Lachnoclostridium sp.]